MTAAALYAFLYSWANAVIPGTTVIQSHQDAPAPAGLYVVIDFSSRRNQQGRATHGPVKTAGTRTIVQDYERMVELWEVNGDGDKLAALIDSVERLEIQALFTAAKVAFLRAGDIIPVPEIEGSDLWRRECMVEIILGTAAATADTPNWIETVEIENVSI